MPHIHPHLWFDHEAEEAMNFYCSIFPNSRPAAASRVADHTMAGEAGEVPTTVFAFELDGQKIIALNAGSHQPYNEALSLYVETKDQAETDRYWNALIADGGVEQPCGWLTDRFGVYWQVTPEALPRLLADKDRQKASRVLQAMFKMKKIIIADLEVA
jgi:predicted 3-demethylubiquinone-9 3-methyltransferase (glyoxalase superfamily)